MKNFENIKISDKILVQQYRQGDNQAMETLVHKHQDRIYNLIYKMCKNTDDAAELTQDTFLKIIENIKTFKNKSSFYTWAFQIATHLTINHLNRKNKIEFKPLDYDDYYQGQPHIKLKNFLQDNKSSDLSVIVQDREICQIIINILMRLDDKYRILILLRDVESMNYSQIARVLNLELGTVKSRLSRARKTLKEIIELVCSDKINNIPCKEACVI
jgi:RNA polymerase sigma-70 factor (ECF subfamily)